MDIGWLPFLQKERRDQGNVWLLFLFEMVLAERDRVSGCFRKGRGEREAGRVIYGAKAPALGDRRSQQIKSIQKKTPISAFLDIFTPF